MATKQLTVDALNKLEIPLHRRISHVYSDSIELSGVLLDNQLVKKKSKLSNERIIHFIVTSEHVDDDGEIDDIASVAKMIPEMLESERGVTTTIMHTDTIVGKVKHLEEMTMGEVANKFPKMKARLNIDVNQDVPCIYGYSKMYDDTPELDNPVWQMYEDGVLSAVSLRGFGTTKHSHSKMCDVEGNCGDKVTNTKFWSVTLCPDGHQAKQYSVILNKLKNKRAGDNNKLAKGDCGGTVEEIAIIENGYKESMTKLKKENLELKEELKTKMTEKTPGEKTKMDENNKDEKDQKDPKDPKDKKKMEYKKMTCPKCGESYEMENEKTKMMDLQAEPGQVVIQSDILVALVNDSKELEKLKSIQELTPEQQYIQKKYGSSSIVNIGTSKTSDQIKMSSGEILTEEKLQKLINKGVKDTIKNSYEELGLKKTKTPSPPADGNKGPSHDEKDKDKAMALPDDTQVVQYLRKMNNNPNYQPDIAEIMPFLTGKIRIPAEAN